MAIPSHTSLNRTTRSTQVTYWEGAIEAHGTTQERPIQGKGYIELTGYAERFNKKLQGLRTAGLTTPDGLGNGV